MRKHSLPALIGTLLIHSAGAWSQSQPVAEPEHRHPLASMNVRTDLTGRTLETFLQEATAKGKIRFEINPALGGDKLAGTIAAVNWSDAVVQGLRGYNYEGELGEHGELVKLIVTGRNGDPSVPPNNRFRAQGAQGPIALRAGGAKLPERLQGLNKGSVNPVTVDMTLLSNMKPGESIRLELPNRSYEVVHDNRFEHENGDLTWVGYLEDAGVAYRVFITHGKDGSIGQITTPEGVYTIDAENGLSWLVDMETSGLEPGGLEGDEVHAGLAEGVVDTAPTPDVIAAELAYAAAGTVTSANTAGAKSAAAGTTAKTVIDVMALYTPALDTAAFKTRLNTLFDMANQAYIDSKVDLSINLVYAHKVSYSDKTTNQDALNELTAGRNAFAGIPALRTQYGADLVALIRPFAYRSQINCGVAWVGGSGGGSFSKGLGFSVVSEGRDTEGTGLYCGNYTLAHELGHNMGSVHDRAHSSFQGKFPYSYGYGVPGKFGDIMSYYNPVVGMFSSPDLICNGLPCGKPITDPLAADNAQSLRLSVPTVAAFMTKPSTTSTAVTTPPKTTTTRTTTTRTTTTRTTTRATTRSRLVPVVRNGIVRY